MIHVFNERKDWQVWTDCEPGEEHSGRCIGSGLSKAAALRNASDELIADLNRVRQLQECESQPSKKP